MFIDFLLPLMEKNDSGDEEDIFLVVEAIPKSHKMKKFVLWILHLRWITCNI